MHSLKSMFFTNWHCYLIISHECHIKWYLLRVRVFLFKGRGAGNIEEKVKTDRRKMLRNEDKSKRRTEGISNNNNKHLWFYLFVKKIYFVQKHSSKKEKSKK